MELLMPSNIAARRAAKAIRRKAILADRRKADLQTGSLAARVNQAANAPLRDCLISDGWAESGMATLTLTRGFSTGNLVMGSFLLDTFCLGIKDVLFRSIDGDEFNVLRDAMGRAVPLSSVAPAYGRKLLRDLAAWATSIGFPPHRDFATVERLFGTVDAEECSTEFRFGRDGRPVYISGPSESPRQVRRRLEQFEERFADAGSGYLLDAPDLLLEG
jgi:hypothetical protein